MNYRMIKYTLGWILLFETGFFIVPLITALAFKERIDYILFSMLASCFAGLILLIGKPKSKKLGARDGFVIVSLSWIFLSLFGALPFTFSGLLPNFADALFEVASGFSTTGASVIAKPEEVLKGLLIWRSFTNWIGGMGVLVFIIAFIPLGGAQNLHIMRAESPGPEVSKLVPKMKATALILYVIYFALTFIQFILLLCGKMNFFDAVCTAFSTAGTGGFATQNDSFLSSSPYIQIVVTVFMLLFSINFSSYYLVMKGKLRDALNLEVRVFCFIVVFAIAVITVNILSAGIVTDVSEAIRHSSFTVASMISTTGFSTIDFNVWPTLSKTLLLIITFIGACAGSTGGGIKVSRIIILFKGVLREFKYAINPRQVKKISIGSKTVSDEVVRGVNSFIACYLVVFVVSVFALSFEGHDLVTTFTAVSSTINNIGPGLSKIGPTGNFAFFSTPSKLVLIFDMLAGRLELIPMVILFHSATWKK